MINVVDFQPLKSPVHIGCFDCELHKATIEMAVALPAADGRACRSLSESFGALEASLREASNAPSMAPQRQACPACDASEGRTGGSGLPGRPPLPTWLTAVFHPQGILINPHYYYLSIRLGQPRSPRGEDRAERENEPQA